VPARARRAPLDESGSWSNNTFVSIEIQSSEPTVQSRYGYSVTLSQKCRYALRAIFELAKRQGNGPITIGNIAEAQAIPPRFLELILAQAKQAGFVESRRGKTGGYLLARDARDIAVSDVIRVFEGPINVVDCGSGRGNEERCALDSDCVFRGLWDDASQALLRVLDGTTFADLLEREQARRNAEVLTYSI
jgi:Rrf2 family cysteine metabolism transcriptional repressor